MPYVSEIEGESLVNLLRTPPCVAPDDSLQRFIDILRYSPFSVLPVVADDLLVGYIHQSDVLFLVGIEDELERQASSYAPVSRFMRPPDTVLSSMSTTQMARKFLAEHGLEITAVTDDRDHYIGVVVSRDLP